MTWTLTSTLTWWTRRAVAGAASTAVVLPVLTGCSMGPDGADTVVAASSSSSVTGSVAPGQPVVLRFGDHAVAARLADTAAGRKLAAMLPLTLELTDTWGQAKAGRLPHAVPVKGAVRTLKPTPGGLYYWPDTATLAVYYDDLDQNVPPPGLVRLGGIEADVDEIADAGHRVTVRIEQASGP